MPELTPDQICERFIETLEFDLYPAQEEALLAWFEGGHDGLMVCAPTGTGKTLIAEAAVFEALHARRRLYYTTPLIALTEQKYRELREKVERWGFSRDDVGFITGNRRENPDALIRVVVAEILLNHLLSSDPALLDPRALSAVVMDEFHSFNDPERGVVWELTLVMLPKHARVMLLSATVGNPIDFSGWLRERHGRQVRVLTSTARRVPLDYHWVGDELLSHLLPTLSEGGDDARRTPALVFCFNRDECWDLAETLKGLKLAPESARKEIERILESEHAGDLNEGVGPKLRQMLIRGVGVHHAGVLPRHKLIVEKLFNARLVPFVICTETLAAGVNLPARSVVLSTLLKGPPREKKLIAPAAAHQMFGRAGRPQFDTQGHVYSVAHDDDVKIEKWKKKLESLGDSKDPGILKMRKQLEKKRPTRRSTEQYWTEGQFRSLIAAPPARLASRGMIPYTVLVFLLTRTRSLRAVREFLANRFATPAVVEKFHRQLDFMLANLAALGYVRLGEGAIREPLPEKSGAAGQGDASGSRGTISAPGESQAPPLRLDAAIELDEAIFRLVNFRSVDPLYGEYLCVELSRAGFEEKILALESVLDVPPKIARRAAVPDGLPRGPLEEHVLRPLLISMGVRVDAPEFDPDAPRDYWAEREERPPRFPDMLKIAFDARLPAPEEVPVQSKWIGGGAFEMECEFFRFVRNRDLVKQEGIVLRHLLRLAILAGEFLARTEDPDYERIAELATRTCAGVDETYTARYLEEAVAARQLLNVGG